MSLAEFTALLKERDRIENELYEYEQTLKPIAASYGFKEEYEYIDEIDLTDDARFILFRTENLIEGFGSTYHIPAHFLDDPDAVASAAAALAEKEAKMEAEFQQLKRERELKELARLKAQYGEG